MTKQCYYLYRPKEEAYSIRMGETTVYLRNQTLHSLYKLILKPIFFSYDPENVHDGMTGLGQYLGEYRWGRKVVSELLDYYHPVLEQKILNLVFKNPVGLSAGFDKNAELTNIIPAAGFGFMEVGSVTGQPCPGNPKPRLWRLPKSQSLAVYYGLKNDGCKVVAQRLAQISHQVPIGVNIAMTNCADNLNLRRAVMDYTLAFKTLEPEADYLTLNVSCPNTIGDQPFMTPFKLDYLLDVIDEISTRKPVFIKLSPDVDLSVIDEIIKVAQKHRVRGFICTNLTKQRGRSGLRDLHVPLKGGFSGKVIEEVSTKLISYIYQQTEGRMVIIGAGGIFKAEDAYRKIQAGASLVQLITGLVYEGPQLISDINQGLVKLLQRDGFHNIAEAVGSSVRKN